MTPVAAGLTDVDDIRLTTSGVALRFFGVSVAAFGCASGLAALIRCVIPPDSVSPRTLPLIFLVTTVLLAIGSLALRSAVRAVRQERQSLFRRRLVMALLAGTLFVAVQGFGLMCLLSGQDLRAAQTGTRPFVFVFAAMHGLHVMVALLFLAFITVRGFAGRYDHEYYRGPIVAEWFWHALGIVWLAILFVMAITA